MPEWLKTKYEALWVRFAARILMGRNLKRCTVVSRRDNNDMWYMAEKLQSVAKRMSTKYEGC